MHDGCSTWNWVELRKGKVCSLHHERNEWKMSSLKKWQNYNTRNKRCFIQIRLPFCWAEWKIGWNITYVDVCCWVEENMNIWFKHHSFRADNFLHTIIVLKTISIYLTYQIPTEWAKLCLHSNGTFIKLHNCTKGKLAKTCLPKFSKV
jgi:hypothetical protein